MKFARPRGGRNKRSSCDNMRKNTIRWTEAELKALIVAVELQKAENNDGASINWSTVAKAVRHRTGKQCREKYLNHLRPNIKKSAWTVREEYILARRHCICGNRWAEISCYLPGRVENDIKNLWNATRRAKPESKQHSLLWHYAHGIDAIGLRPKESLLQAVSRYLGFSNVPRIDVNLERLKKDLERDDDSGQMPELAALPGEAVNAQQMDTDGDEALSFDEDEVLSFDDEEDEDEEEEAGCSQPVPRGTASRPNAPPGAPAAVRPDLPAPPLPKASVRTALDMSNKALAAYEKAAKRGAGPISAEHWLLNHADEFLTDISDSLLLPGTSSVAAAEAAPAQRSQGSPMRPPLRPLQAAAPTAHQGPKASLAPASTSGKQVRTLLAATPNATPTALRKQALLRNVAQGTDMVPQQHLLPLPVPTLSSSQYPKCTPITEEYRRTAACEPRTSLPTGRMIDWHTPALPTRADQMICAFPPSRSLAALATSGDNTTRRTSATAVTLADFMLAAGRQDGSASPSTIARPTALSASEQTAGKHTPLWKMSPAFTPENTIFSPGDFSLKPFGLTPLLVKAERIDSMVAGVMGPPSAVPPAASTAAVAAAAPTAAAPTAVKASAAAARPAPDKAKFFSCVADSPGMRFVM